MIRQIVLCPKITEIKFCAWLAQAKPGEALEYHRGFLCLDRGGFETATETKDTRALNQVARRAYALAQGDFIHLVQRRVGPDTFSYFAIARPKPHGKVMDFKTLMQKEAA